jgi:hypothetical protein
LSPIRIEVCSFDNIPWFHSLIFPFGAHGYWVRWEAQRLWCYWCPTGCFKWSNWLWLFI